MSAAMRGQATTQAAALSVASNGALILVKLAVGIYTGAVSIIAEALHSGLDLAAALMALFAVRRASRPADRTHPYGHGKFESLSGLLEGLLIFGAAALIVYIAAHRMLHGHRVQHETLGVAVMAVSALANMLVSGYLFRVARRHDSLALAADAWHLRTDVYSSLAVLVGMAAIALGAPAVLDPVAAVIVAVVILHAAYKLCAEACAQLLDRALPPDEEQAIIRLIQEHAGDFVSFHNVRTRKAGTNRHIDLHVVVAPEVSVGDAHDIGTHLEQEITALFPDSSVMTHIEPPDRKEASADRRGNADGE